MRIAVLGAGAWGTALAAAAAARHEVLLWARDRVQTAQIERDRCNRRYLPETSLPASLRVSAEHAQALDFAAGGLLVVATPMNALRERLAALPGDANVVWLCKGLEAGSGLLGHEIAAQVRPRARVGVLSGPSFAQEVACALPTAVVAASVDPALCALAVQAFHSDSLRVYTSTDPVGVEVGGAVKNVIAIAAGHRLPQTSAGKETAGGQAGGHRHCLPQHVDAGAGKNESHAAGLRRAPAGQRR